MIEKKNIKQRLFFTYNADGEESVVRLDKYLTEKMPTYSRSSIKQLIDDGNITINEKLIRKSGFILKNSDTIVVSLPLYTIDLSRAKDLDLDIIDEKEDFLIINKPAGLLVHEAASSKGEISLVDGLLYHFKDFNVFDDKVRPGIVHRLDRNTSGLIIIARNQEAQRELCKLFKDRQVHKTYKAVVEGHPGKSGQIDFSIGRHASQRYKMTHHNAISPREALTYYEVLKYYKDVAFIKAMPVTGRTHQIRVHLAAINHSIIGDELYGEKSKLIARQALHSWRVSFEYKGLEYNYEAPEPEDMKYLLNNLASL